jgi:hypothetical protein
MADTKTSQKLVGPAERKLRETATAHRAVSTKPGKIDMKGAVQAAIAFAKDMFPQAKDILLEEVEARSGGWSVVISFVSSELSTLSQVMGGRSRLFKTIAIDSTSGQAQSLKVWKQ